MILGQKALLGSRNSARMLPNMITAGERPRWPCSSPKHTVVAWRALDGCARQCGVHVDVERRLNDTDVPTCLLN